MLILSTQRRLSVLSDRCRIMIILLFFNKKKSQNTIPGKHSNILTSCKQLKQTSRVCCLFRHTFLLSLYTIKFTFDRRRVPLTHSIPDRDIFFFKFLWILEDKVHFYVWRITPTQRYIGVRTWDMEGVGGGGVGTLHPPPFHACVG